MPTPIVVPDANGGAFTALGVHAPGLPPEGPCLCQGHDCYHIAIDIVDGLGRNRTNRRPDCPCQRAMAKGTLDDPPPWLLDFLAKVKPLSMEDLEAISRCDAKGR